MKALKYVSFGLLAVLVVLLVAATVAEKIYGSSAISRHVYGAWWFVALWAVAALFSALFMLRKKLYRKPFVFALHASFFLILAGALVTWIFGQQGHLHLRADGLEATCFEDAEGHVEYLPFSVRLEDFHVDCYPGTQTPMDYVSELSVRASRHDSLRATVSMNRILRFKGYRFYQASYDADMGGSTLAVSHDPWGIGVTYAGYLLLFLSMIAFFFDSKSGFRVLLNHPALRRTLCIAAFLPVFAFGKASTAAAPPTMPREVAKEWGNLHVYYNGRICPLSTLAHDFCLKITKKDHYKNLTAEQFLSGWTFYHDSWKNEPLSLRSEECSALLNMVSNQALFRLFPYFDSSLQAVRWVSPVDRLPAYIGYDTSAFILIKFSLNYLNELLLSQNYDEAVSVIRKIGVWQQRQAAEVLPPKARFAAEKFYHRANRPLGVAVCLLLVGFAAFIGYCRRMAVNRAPNLALKRLLVGLLCIGIVYLSVMLAVRAWVCGHLPFSNGYETMQMIAWLSLLATLLFFRKADFLLPLGFLVAGLAMMVSMMGSSNPQITPLMPVLSSPLLSIHVMSVMISYTLFAFMMLNGIAGLWLYFRHKDASMRLAVVGRLMLYPAVFTLAAGIFIGAIWANVSWGRYWGWDPKEVWALITFIVYSFALHGKSFPSLNRPAVFHTFSVIAFLCVLITYFGVNFLLGGMHGYV